MKHQLTKALIKSLIVLTITSQALTFGPRKPKKSKGSIRSTNTNQGGSRYSYGSQGQKSNGALTGSLNGNGLVHEWHAIQQLTGFSKIAKNSHKKISDGNVKNSYRNFEKLDLDRMEEIEEMKKFDWFAMGINFLGLVTFFYLSRKRAKEDHTLLSITLTFTGLSFVALANQGPKLDISLFLTGAFLAIFSLKNLMKKFSSEGIKYTRTIIAITLLTVVAFCYLYKELILFPLSFSLCFFSIFCIEILEQNSNGKKFTFLDLGRILSLWVSFYFWYIGCMVFKGEFGRGGYWGCANGFLVLGSLVIALRRKEKKMDEKRNNEIFVDLKEIVEI